MLHASTSINQHDIDYADMTCYRDSHSAPSYFDDNIEDSAVSLKSPKNMYDFWLAKFSIFRGLISTDFRAAIT